VSGRDGGGLAGQVLLAPGVRLWFDGELVEVVELAAARVGVRMLRTGGLVSMGLVDLVAGATAVDAEGRGPRPEGRQEPAGTLLAALGPAQQRAVRERAGHVREVLTGFRSGYPDRAGAGEPWPEFTDTLPLLVRYRNKARQLGVSQRTVERWVVAYRDRGEAGLVDTRVLRPRGRWVDPRWDAAARAVLAELVDASTPTRAAVVERIGARLEETFGTGTVAVPSRATAYRRLEELTKGTNAVAGSAKGRRSIADRPRGVYGRLRATRPGEYLVLDTQDLDVFAMEPVTCRWVRAQLTVAQDLFSRCVAGLRVTPVSTRAVDVAGVLYDAVVPHPAPPGWPPQARWPYQGVPERVVFDEADDGWRGPVCAPETLVIDHGKAFLSAHVISVCTRLGISIQPAQPHKPTDKPTLERFFKTLREGLIQHLPAYKGPDVFSRGDRLEDEAFLFVHELEDVIREWVAAVYHCRKHEGLCLPELAHLTLSPAEMFEIGQARAGVLRIPATPELAYDFLPVAARTIQHYGVEVDGLRYNGPGLEGYRNTTSPYGGALAGKWPIRVNPDDVRYAWFQDPADGAWHRLDWEHAPALGAPFTADAARHARRLALAATGTVDPAQALRELLARWDKGMVSGRRERNAAARLAAQYQALPVTDPADDQPQTGPLEGPPARHLQVVGPACDGIVGDDDDADDLLATSDFYADAFDVLD
jgi:putative transposase